MSIEEITTLLTEQFGEEAVEDTDAVSTPATLQVSASLLDKICAELFTNEQTYFDYLSCITALDNGVAEGTLEVIYHLYSIPFNVSLAIKVKIDRQTTAKQLPQIPSVSHIWKTADWHEREAFDLVGVHFSNHPDLRRILLPADWEGHPLRKDYELQETYHGIHVAYENPTPPTEQQP